MPKRILLLDNNNDGLNLADEMMYYGYSDVHITSNCESVYSIAKSFQPDLIILDFLLINEQAKAVCHSVKQDDVLKNIPVVLISGHINKKTELSRDSYDALFIKPLNPETLALNINYLVAS
ncbi:response regulator [Mucilaginibacter robiniae]|uniref:Response regulator n=1 Tax=Mucilaginibacter robiniae TaxID=2728022 RepID=A0A7L5E7F1_9SPHI|nr:response regulator [Mucilaginibacter robiniae]QJD96296.1 response regulator [Mucilaginibacter robiniae]